MTYKTVYWDDVAKEQRERDCTVDETAEIDARKIAPPPVPREVLMLAFVFALDDAGTQEAAVDAVIAALPASKTKRRLKSWWNKSTSIRRGSPQLAALAALMPWTGAELDALFIAAQGVDL